MNKHLALISANVTAGAHAVLLLDKAGWHTTPQLRLPENITLLPLPARCPELNPVENIWQYMRENWLNDLVFRNYDHIVDTCSKAWRKLIDRPRIVRSIGMVAWAHEF